VYVCSVTTVIAMDRGLKVGSVVNHPELIAHASGSWDLDACVKVLFIKKSK